MAHVVTSPCFDCKYTDCVVVCPCECFYGDEQMLYIDPEDCIDCEACIPECPVEAIYPEPNVPAHWTHFIQLNTERATELKATGGRGPVTEQQSALLGPACKSGPVASTGATLTASSLSNDLGRYASEFYTKGDLDAGLKVVKEVGGIIMVGGFLLSAVTIWLPAVGITLGAATVAQLVYRVGSAYEKASAEERKQIRAAIKYIKGGFSLGDKLLG